MCTKKRKDLEPYIRPVATQRLKGKKNKPASQNKLALCTIFLIARLKVSNDRIFPCKVSWHPISLPSHTLTSSRPEIRRCLDMAWDRWVCTQHPYQAICSPLLVRKYVGVGIWCRIGGFVPNIPTKPYAHLFSSRIHRCWDMA